MKNAFLITIALVTALGLYSGDAIGATIDRVIAYIDNTAITMRELDAEHNKNLPYFPSRTRKQTLEAMINTSLMLQDARRLHLLAKDDDELLQKYLDLKIRALVLVSEKDISAYFSENRARFGKRSLRELKPELRTYLEELRFNIALKEHISALRETAVIKIISY
ncbi:hypothetical protein ACFL4R_00765 [Nitrospirota bacterium]